MTQRLKLLETLDLIRLAKDDDPDALNVLLHRYAPFVEHEVARKTSDKLRKKIESSDLVNDILKEIFLGFQRFELRDETSFRAWIRRVSENRIRKWARFYGAEKRSGFRSVVSGDATSPSQLRTPSILGASPSKVASNREDVAHLQQRMSKLPEDVRELIVLRLKEGLSWSAIAERLGVSENAARQKYQRAKAILRSSLDSGG